MENESMNKWLAEWFDQNEEKIYELMKDLWAHPEVGLKEYHACEAAAKFAREQGFTSVETHAAEDYDNPDAKPNTLIAKWGSGKPVIGIVGELDALPGLGQEEKAEYSPTGGPGHGCGHNTMAGGAMAGACALRYAMEKEGLSGTVKLIEAPAEEIGQGKAYLAKDGVFDDVDMTLMWHPGPTDLDFSPVPQLVAFRAQFDFYGKTSHAALPWQGRSAVDAVQLMNLGCEFLREHMPQGALMHYCITDGGTAPNIVPEHGSSIYMFRVLDNYAETENLFQRAVKCAEGAAMMTDTRVEYKVLSVVPQYYYNLPLCEHVANAAKKIPVFSYAEEDYEMARSLYKNVTGQESPYPDEELLPIRVLPFREEKDGLLGCTDAADMTYYSPSLQIQGLGRIKDLPGGHHWTTSVISGCGIGWKPAVYGYKIIAQAAYDALKDPSIVQKCWDAYHAMNIPEHKDWL